eukprot:CAMPEP_0172408852 /NCGR_PEP_ID=MMETSP1061-20121228/76066_1 /TAXON_ID=37318 /ORGANISM="Pseudo-nitzschia pungens, Strain cf. pungens" /LENGTH=673 /DNA_ID=CAMNT_0013144995 /DNA_START=398 /DNA_END=2420 /DNA_ORIENTATION=-
MANNTATSAVRRRRRNTTAFRNREQSKTASKSTARMAAMPALSATVVLCAMASASTSLAPAEAFVVSNPISRSSSSSSSSSCSNRLVFLANAHRIRETSQAFRMELPTTTTMTTKTQRPTSRLFLSDDKHGVADNHKDDDDDNDTKADVEIVSPDDNDDDFDNDDFDNDFDDFDDNDFIDVEGGEDYDEEEEEDPEDDPYVGMVPYEFGDEPSAAAAATESSSSALAAPVTTDMDWGGALGALRSRVDDLESGKGGDPSQALFRMMSAPSPNQIIGRFVASANPQVVQAMSGAVTSLLGGLSNPSMGVEVQVKASGEKIGSLCFQLQMTGYMFRNAEYVLALKQLMKLNAKGAKLTIEDYKEAFDRLDTDKSGFIELSEIQNLFKEAYGGKEEDVPPFEIKAFLEFFDINEDGKISWEEFERGLTSTATATSKTKKDEFADRLLASMEANGSAIEDEDGGDEEDDDEEEEGSDLTETISGTIAAIEDEDGGDEEDDDEEEEGSDLTETISGTIEIEMDDGKIVVVDAKEYMENLKEEAQKLKLALRKEQEGSLPNGGNNPADPMAGLGLPNNPNGADEMVDIASYIASRQGDVRSLTEGIKPEIVDTMKKLVDFVLEGGDAGRGRKDLTDQQKAEMEMEIPGSALQQLALWQLVLGYRLREEEAKGEYIKLLK